MRRMRGEDGVALALALAFLAGFGVLTGALLGFAETGTRTTGSLRGQTQNLYALDGAVDGAINAIRGNALFGRDPAMSAIPCPTNTFSAGGVSVAVACQGEPGSGWGASGKAPDHAILTTSTHAGERGIEQVSPVSVTVNGSIFSNSDVLNSGTGSVMTVTGDLEAVSTCTATPPAQIVATGTKYCSNEAVQADPAHGVDPGYSPASAVVPAYRTVPGCPGANTEIDLLPGTYADAAALTALTDGSCSGSLVHLAPDPAGGVGVYYFDFRDAGEHEWVISDAFTNVVGGTAKGWIAVPSPGPRPAVPYPGACKVDADVAPKDGIQIIFGGDSRMRLAGGKVELCPQPSTTSQEISIYGARSGSGSPITAEIPTTAVLSSSGYTGGANAHAIEGAGAPVEAVADLAVLSPSANLQLWDVAPSIPVGSLVTSARLRAAHREGPTKASVLTISTTVSLGSRAASASVTPNTAYTEESLPLAALEGLYEGGLLRTNYTTLLNPLSAEATSRLDGLILEITYEAPAFRAQSGCLVAQPYVSGSPTTCAVIRATGTAGLAIQGTVYSPLAPIDVEVTNVSAQIFNRGIISRIARLGVAPVAGFAGGPIGVVRADRVVSFTGISGGTTLKARATFADGGGLTPGATVTIDRWTVRR